jgi:hypothetical protein
MRPLEEEARPAPSVPDAPGACADAAAVRPAPRAQELKQVFEKLHKYIGKSVEALVNRPDAPHVFRLHKKACCAACGRAPRRACRAAPLR